MKKNIIEVMSLTAAISLFFAACSQADNAPAETMPAATTALTENAAKESSAENTSLSAETLNVKFGYEGKTFTMKMEDNDTARAIVRHVGTADWNLPIYNFEGYEGCENFQYYDIPSRYEIPDGSTPVLSEKGGDVYYSEPNRIVLFYHDAQVEAEYTKIGTIDYTDEFVKAVEENPIIEGWGNKIVSVSPSGK